MNYLLDDKSLISIRSRAITLRQLDPQRIVSERPMWQLVNVAATRAIALLLVAGLALAREAGNTPIAA